jgi:hypothetical protein
VLTSVNNNQIPVNYELMQNYPNPFNPVTKISYRIPTQGIVTITVTDVLGREAAVLVNELKQAGTYDVVFDGKNYSSGVYFYRINVRNNSSTIGGEFTDTKKMVLIK